MYLCGTGLFHDTRRNKNSGCHEARSYIPQMHATPITKCPIPVVLGLPQLSPKKAGTESSIFVVCMHATCPDELLAEYKLAGLYCWVPLVPSIQLIADA